MKLDDLKKEIPFKWRVQSANQYGATCVAYIDARDVQDLFDEVCGPENWQCRFSEHKGNLFCEIGVRVKENEECWVWKSDCGTESQVEKEKGEASDSFKRAAVMFGIGRFLYSKAVVKLPVKANDKGKYIPWSEKTQKHIANPDQITKWCNELSKQK
jgi:hypothetical protein